MSNFERLLGCPLRYGAAVGCYLSFDDMDFSRLHTHWLCVRPWSNGCTIVSLSVIQWLTDPPIHCRSAIPLPQSSAGRLSTVVGNSKIPLRYAAALSRHRLTNRKQWMMTQRPIAAPAVRSLHPAPRWAIDRRPVHERERALVVQRAAVSGRPQQKAILSSLITRQ